MAYDIYCDFDIEKHKQKYINYLEVMILQDGKIVYAVPSHQMKAEQLCCGRLGTTTKELWSKCINEGGTDYMAWLLTQCEAVAVWNDFYIAGALGLNKRQRLALKRLKLHGLYRGAI